MELTVGMVSLGCAKNRVDSEIILGNLNNMGYSIIGSPAEADIIIVNTCGFIGPAKEESIDTILEMAQFKEEGTCRCLIVTGCLSARYRDELLQEIPEIDALLGTNELHRVSNAIESVLAGNSYVEVSDKPFSYDDPDIKRVLSTGTHSAFLKIAEGCSHSCAFCVIPQIRGPYRSRPANSIIQEAKGLAESGIKELVLIAQDTTEYGLDLAMPSSLPELLRELVTLDFQWIRVLYTYPTMISDEFLSLMAAEPKIAKYVDLPLQHVSEHVLRSMKRPGSYSSTVELIAKIRTMVPDVFIRSSFIVGFPGETEQDFAQLLKFIEENPMDHVGIFPFSAEEGTAAVSFPNQVPDSVKEQRHSRAMEVQRTVSLERNKLLIGTEQQVLIDGISPETDLLIVGRHQGQAPEVDGVVYIGNRLAVQGDILRVKIMEAHPYDLVGEIVEEGRQ